MKLRNRLTGMLMLLSLGLFAKEIDPSNQGRMKSRLI